MKNQYFGDVNDYRKYGLLRVLTSGGSLGTGICWMLTDSDGRNDGGRIQYLTQPIRWRRYDPDLYDALVRIVNVDRCRDVARANEPSMLEGMLFQSSMISNNRVERQRYFQETMLRFIGLDLIFFDPDNGIEVRSTPAGRMGSCKYVYWNELKQTFDAGHSLLVYQHFPFKRRIPFIERLTNNLSGMLNAGEVHAYKTTSVVFFLVPQERHIEFYRNRLSEVNFKWEGQIQGTIYVF